ncbi:MAG: ATP-binding protein [Balneolaceae bacterium]
MNLFTQSFYGKLSIVFLLLILLLGGSLAYLSMKSSLMFVEETTQKVNKDLAFEMAMEIQPFLNEAIEVDNIQNKIEYLQGINPQVDIYLVGGNGMIKGVFLGEESSSSLQLDFVETEPLDKYLSGEELPILGQDPLNPKVLKPFSVANVSIMGEQGCYLYVILGGKLYDETAGMLAESYIIKNTMLGLGIIIAGTILLGLLIFRWLTHRLRDMTSTVMSFEHGQLEERVEINSKDEIGVLGSSFNQMADTLVANMDEIKQVDKLRRELIANVSHDLRSPLASIQGYLETIQQKDKTLSNEDRNRYYDIVLRNTRKLGNLIAELFELSKLDAKNVQPELEPVSIAELSQDLVAQFQPQALEKEITLKAILPNEPLNLVNADIALMERAISNLIDNAIKNTPNSGEVYIIPANAGNRVSVEISDTGVGIPQDQISRIFDRFYQTDPSRTGDSGVGLGLSIAQKILELHGSKLSVKSVLNKGTTFSFSLLPYTD